MARLLTEAGLSAAFDPWEFLVAMRGGAVIGCARLRPLAEGSVELASVAVEKAARGSGVGKRLVTACLKEADAPVLALALAPGFFARFGFEPLAEVPPALADRACTECASQNFVPMRREPRAR